MDTAADILAVCPPSLGAALADRAGLTPDREAFRFRDDLNHWVSLTWAQLQSDVHELAAGLLALGLAPEERVAVASSTRIEWVLADFSIACAGGATTSIYPNTTAEDFCFILRDSGSSYLIAENAEQLAKADADPEVGAQLRHVVLLEGAGDGERVLSWSQLRELGRKHLAEQPECVKAAVAGTNHDSLATLIYTSGTTGAPKGVELLHSCWLYQAESIDRMGIIDESHLQYLWLPLSHVFGKCLLSIQLAIGFATAVDGRLDQILPGLGETKPTLMCGAPRIFEKVRAAVLTSTPTTGVKGRIARWAFAVGRASRPYRLAGKKLPPAMNLAYTVADRLVFSKLKERMGGRIEFFVSGAAKLNAQVQAWYYSAGLILVEGYGATETSAVSFVNHPTEPRFGTVGTVIPGTQARIAEDGEVLLKGPGVMRGYHNDPEKTAEVLIDGWYHTGDIGEIDGDGYLRITDRKRDLLKTSGGKYVAPQKVESALVANIPIISQAVALGNDRKYIVALLTLDPDNLGRWAKNNGLADVEYGELTQHPKVRDYVDQLLPRANSRLERWETVKRYAILDHELTVDEGGVTPNMKVRRNVVGKRYAQAIDSLYDAEPADPTE